MDARPQRRVLVVSPNHDVLDPSTGTGYRLSGLIRELARDNEVDVLLPAEHAGPAPEWVGAVHTFSQLSTHYLTDANPSFARAMARIYRRRSPDLVHVAQPKGVLAAKAVGRLVGHEVPVIYGSQIVAAEVFHQSDAVPAYKRALGPLVIPWIERLTVATADYVTTVSETDRQRFLERYDLDPADVAAVPTGTDPVDADDLDPPEAVRDRYDLDADLVAVFHGAYAHPPNRAAVEAIVERIAPAVREHVDLEVLLVGEGMPAAESRGVYAAGFVEDLPSALAAADLAVVPITHGGGTKTKIFDYMAVGLPMVVTETGARGIDLEDGRDARIVDGVGSAFVDAVRDLAEDPAERRRLGENLRGLAETTYSWEESGQRLRAVVDALLDGGPEATVATPPVADE